MTLTLAPPSPFFPLGGSPSFHPKLSATSRYRRRASSIRVPYRLPCETHAEYLAFVAGRAKKDGVGVSLLVSESEWQ